MVYRLVYKPTLGVRFPKAKRNTLSTAAELVENHPGGARVHRVVPIESTDRIKPAILVVNTNIIDPDAVLILAPIFGHARISLEIKRGVLTGIASAVTRQLDSLKFN